MSDLIIDNTYLILLLPLWIFLIIMCGRFFAVYVNKIIIYVLTLLSSFLGILLCSASLFKLDYSLEQNFEFIRINSFSIPVGIYIDKISLIVALVLFSVSFLVQAFSINYMKDEAKQYRFYAFLNMFNFSMAGLLFSPNLFQMYFFWELVGVMSYLLIGFDYKKTIKSESSRRVFLMNRFGDTALITSILATSYFMFNYAGNPNFVSLNFEDFNAISIILSAYTSTPLFYVICILFIIGAAVKSAQFPFFTWLQDAMEAKLPVSALLHSATMVVAGAYLLIRLLPFFTLAPNLLNIIITLGLLTALICSILASIETHPKKVLAYSTSANLGLIFLAIGLLDIKVALIFLIAHAFIKSALFLLLDDIDYYVNYITFLIGGLSLAGLIFSGLIAKELLYSTASNNIIISTIYCITAFFTAFYIIRIALVLIKDKKLINKVDFKKFIPIGLLFILNITFYFFIRNKIEYKIAEPFYCAIFGWGFAYILYLKNLITKFNKTPDLLENFYNKTLVCFYDKISQFCNFIELKILSNYTPLIKTTTLSVKIFGLIENNIMNKSVEFVVNSAKKLSEWGAKLQCRNVQTYNAYGFILITIMIVFVIICYTMMFNQFS